MFHLRQVETVLSVTRFAVIMSDGFALSGKEEYKFVLNEP